MEAEPENILILKQADDCYCVVIEDGVRPTGFTSGLNRDEALGVVAAKLMGGKLPGYYRTLEGVASEAMARVEDAAGQVPPPAQDRSRVGEWTPLVYIDKAAAPSTVALCLRDDPSETVVYIRAYGFKGHLFSSPVDRAKWDAARFEWAQDGGDGL